MKIKHISIICIIGISIVGFQMLFNFMNACSKKTFIDKYKSRKQDASISRVNISESSNSPSAGRRKETGSDRHLGKFQHVQNIKPLLTQEEVEKLGIPSLSARTNDLCSAYTEYAGLSEADQEFLKDAVATLIEEVKKIETRNSRVIENTPTKTIVYVSAFPADGTNLEAEFRNQLRERLGEWQEDFFMKLNKNYFDVWLAEFGQMEQQFTIEIGNQDLHKITLATVIPIGKFQPKELAHEVTNRIRREKGFEESFIPNRFSHLFEMK